MADCSVTLRVVVAAIALALFTGHASATFGQRSADAAEIMPAPHEYLYVADFYGPGYGGHGVSRFPIRPDGLPSTTPDLTLDGNLINPCCLAVDKGGHLFVVDNTAALILEYPHGASGKARPIRSLVLESHDYPQYIAVDRSGYLYVEDESLGVVDVFAPGAHGRQHPLHKIANWNTQGGIIRDLAVDSRGALYVALMSDAIYIYDDPAHEWAQANVVLHVAHPKWYVPNYFSATLDEAAGLLYVPMFPEIQQSWAGDFAITPCPVMVEQPYREHFWARF